MYTVADALKIEISQRAGCWVGHDSRISHATTSNRKERAEAPPPINTWVIVITCVLRDPDSIYTVCNDSASALLLF